jgi:hypothetical protein
MFDVMATARCIGVSSLIGEASVGIALFIAVAVLMIKRKNDPIADLSLLSLVSLVPTVGSGMPKSPWRNAR